MGPIGLPEVLVVLGGLSFVGGLVYLLVHAVGRIQGPTERRK